MPLLPKPEGVIEPDSVAPISSLSNIQLSALDLSADTDKLYHRKWQCQKFKEKDKEKKMFMIVTNGSIFYEHQSFCSFW